MADRYDLVVVGGGIHGVGVAQAAVAQGCSVLVLEQTALAGGTSGRSSKLIHGGLRYLESGQFSLVRESLRERRILLKLAPELVRLVPFYIPVYKTTRRRPWQIRAGLSLYALLGGLAADNRFSTVPKADWGMLDGIDPENLQAVFCYQDGQTDDAALTRAVMRSAQTLGAELIMPARLVGAKLEQDFATIEYQHQGQTFTCEASVLVNAAGPWVTQVLESVQPRQPPFDMELVRGTHIRVPGPGTSAVYYMEVPEDGRAVFAMPGKDGVLVGTTETIYTAADPGKVEPTQAEQDYLLKVLAHYFPHYRRAENRRILSAFAGLRVLPAGDGRTFNRSRETLLVEDRRGNPRLLSIYGGKLTTWRATAEKVMRRLQTSLPAASKARVKTSALPLYPD